MKKTKKENITLLMAQTLRENSKVMGEMIRLITMYANAEDDDKGESGEATAEKDHPGSTRPSRHQVIQSRDAGIEPALQYQ